MITALGAYLIGTRYVSDPQVVALLVLVLAIILLIIDFIIVRGFERLAEANIMKSEFISVTSHQLRSPLSNLNWTIELLMSGRLGSIEKEQREYFKILKDNINRMGTLIKDLLIVSKIETQTLLLKEKEFSLEELIKKIISEFKPLARASNLEIEFEHQENLPRAFGDPFQIRQVLENLLDNAVRYTPLPQSVESQKQLATKLKKEKIRIELKLKGKQFYFEIKDSGVGIPKEEQKYIFQKFFRAGNVMKYQTEGSGLGLYIAKSIIEKSKGKIGFESQEDKGSTFWFTLPIK